MSIETNNAILKKIEIELFLHIQSLNKFHIKVSKCLD